MPTSCGSLLVRCWSWQEVPAPLPRFRTARHGPTTKPPRTTLSRRPSDGQSPIWSETRRARRAASHLPGRSSYRTGPDGPASTASASTESKRRPEASSLRWNAGRKKRVLSEALWEHAKIWKSSQNCSGNKPIEAGRLPARVPCAPIAGWIGKDAVVTACVHVVRARWVTRTPPSSCCSPNCKTPRSPASLPLPPYSESRSDSCDRLLYCYRDFCESRFGQELVRIYRLRGDDLETDLKPGPCFKAFPPTSNVGSFQPV